MERIYAKKPRSSMMATEPSVTVIMPIQNEGEYIERSLRSVLEQRFPSQRMEVFVVDGMSDDNTREIIQHLCASFPDRKVAILDNPNRVVPTAFNLALRHASGDIIIRVDGHCEIAPDYLHRCVELLEETGADNVGGRQQAEGSGVVARTIALATSSPFGVGNAWFHYSEEPRWSETVYLGAWPREVFERVGGFDEELVRNQDDEFNFRLMQAGGKIWFDPSIRSTYFSRTSLRSLWRQYFQYGFYKVRVIQKRAAVASWRHVVPGMFVVALVLSLILAATTGQTMWAIVVAGPYGAANILATLLVARDDWQCLLMLPTAFAILHLAYGLGFVSGLWHWRNRWRSEGRYPPVILEN